MTFNLNQTTGADGSDSGVPGLDHELFMILTRPSANLSSDNADPEVEPDHNANEILFPPGTPEDNGNNEDKLNNVRDHGISFRIPLGSLNLQTFKLHKPSIHE